MLPGLVQRAARLQVSAAEAERWLRVTFICPGADITTSPASDFKGLGCDALSLAASFGADPAVFGDPRKPDSSGCGDPADPEYAPLFDCAP